METDKELTIHVKSQDLKRLFLTFNILDMDLEFNWSLILNSSIFPYFNDNLEPSFARRLLSALQCKNIVYEINRLSERVFVLQKNVSNQADFWTSGSIPVFEVEVVFTQGTLKVNEKVC